MDNPNLVLGIIGDQLECGLRQWVDPPALLRLELDNLFYVWLFDHSYPSLLNFSSFSSPSLSAVAGILGSVVRSDGLK